MSQPSYLWDDQKGFNGLGQDAFAGKLRNTQLERLEEAAKRLADAEDAVRDDEVRVDLPDTSVPAGGR